MSISTELDLAGLRRAGRLVAATLREMKQRLKAGMTTKELDIIAGRFLVCRGGRSAPQMRFGFPGFTCISINDEAVHGIPSGRTIQPGDLVKLDVTAELDGYVADAAVTVAVAPACEQKRLLCEAAESALTKAIAIATAGLMISEIGAVVEEEVQRHGFLVLRELAGHGVGRAVWEAPRIPNFRMPNDHTRLEENAVITIEPIISVGTRRTAKSEDGWTISSADGSLSAHFEHTIIITSGRPLVLTAA